MKIPLVQHFLVAFILSVVIAICPFLLFPSWWDVVGQVLVLFAIFGFVGLLWMLFEGKTSQKSVFFWLTKLIRGIFIWGFLLGVLIWNFRHEINILAIDHLDFGVIMVFMFGFFMGLILSLMLSVYSYFFIRTD